MSLAGSGRDARVLLVGAGGLGCPVALILAQSGFGRLTVLDDDRVALENLHRQVLYREEDIGRPKAQAAVARLKPWTSKARAIDQRLVPDNAVDLVREHDLVIEGSDNYATKFLALDASTLAGVPIVQAGAVRWNGWALASGPVGACARCVFEDLPPGRADTCAAAGVVGPVVGVLGALAASLAIRVLMGDSTAFGQLFSYDGRAGRISKLRPTRRADCARCAGTIDDVEMSRYVATASY